MSFVILDLKQSNFKEKNYDITFEVTWYLLIFSIIAYIKKLTDTPI